MPKEYIEAAWFGKTSKQIHEDGSTSEYDVEVTALKIGWNKNAPEGYVQAAVVRREDGSFNDNAAQHMMLNRDGINRIIRTLRRARDEAFGNDA